MLTSLNWSCAVSNFDRHAVVCEMHVALRIPYMYDYIRKLQEIDRSHPKSP
jgi:hypothetical protein